MDEHIRLLKSIPDFPPKSILFHNKDYVVWKCKELLQLLKEDLPGLRCWCEEELANHNQLYHVEYWLEHGWNFLSAGINNLRFPPDKSFLSPIFQQSWEAICEMLGINLKNAFQHAYSELLKMHAIQSPDNCDVPAIKEIHAGKPCHSNGMYCWTCEEVEDKWHETLVERLKATGNIFLNKDAKGGLLAKARIPLPPRSWEPPATNPQVEPRGFPKEVQWKTAPQVMYFIVEFAEWRQRLDSKKTPFEKFVHTWTYVQQLEPLLQSMEEALTQISPTQQQDQSKLLQLR